MKFPVLAIQQQHRTFVGVPYITGYEWKTDTLSFLPNAEGCFVCFDDFPPIEVSEEEMEEIQIGYNTCQRVKRRV